MKSITYSYLRKLYHRIASDCDCSHDAYQELQTLKPEQMTIHQYGYVLYLRGYYHRNQWEALEDLRDLEAANVCFDEIFVGMRNVRESRYYFKRARTKLDLSFALDDVQDSQMLREKALQVCEAGLECYPENAHLLWLRNEIIDKQNEASDR